MKKIIFIVIGVGLLYAGFRAIGFHSKFADADSVSIPSTVSDLSITIPSVPNTIISWTAPGDDGTVGVAGSYDVRYAKSPIKDDAQCATTGSICTKWDDATPVLDVLKPDPAGTYERVSVSNLSPNIKYYVALKTTSKEGTVSTLSNVASYTLFPAAPSYSVVSGHPRIWLTPTVLKGLRAQMQSNSVAWQNLKGHVDAMMPFADPSSADYDPSKFIGSPAEWDGLNFALVYQLTGDKKYADAALQVISTVIKSADFTRKSCPVNEIRWVHYTLPINFDWIYGTLGASTIATIENAFLNEADICANKNNVNFGNLVNFNGYEAEIRFAGMTGLAVYGDSPFAKAYIDMGLDSTFEGLTWPQYLSTKMAGGTETEGPEYSEGTIWSAEDLWQAYDTATGIDEYSTAAGQKFLQDNVQFTLSEMSSGPGADDGNGKLIPVLGDLEKGNDVPAGGWADYDPTPYGTVSSDDFHNMIEYDYYRLPLNSQSSQWAKYLLDNVLLSGCQLSNECSQARSYDAPEEVGRDFLFYDPAGSSDNYNNDAPLDTVAPGPGIATFRSGWGGTETIVNFSSEWKGTDHDYGDANEFAIMKDGQYLNRNEVGYNSLFSSSYAQNTMILGPSDRISSGTQFTYIVNPACGTDCGRAGVGGGALIDFATTSAYSYAVGDATDLYNINPTCYQCAPYTRVNTFIRELVYLRPDTIVEFDRVSLPSSTYQQTWIDHSANMPTVINSTTITQTSRDGSEQLFTHVDWPADPQISFINQTTTPDYCGSSGPVCNYGWATHITPGTPSTNPIFLNTIFAADSNVSSMPATQNIDAGKMIGVYIEDPTTPSVVMFSSSPNRTGYTTDMGSPLNYTITPSSQMIAHHLMDMPANATFSIYQGGIKIATQNTNNAGVLDFDSNGGGPFTIEASAVSGNPNVPTAGALDRDLSFGSTGSDVATLQHLLAQDGDYTAGIFSGYYGSLTQKAVQVFQAKYDIVNYGDPDTTGYGSVGPKTRMKLNNLY